MSQYGWVSVELLDRNLEVIPPYSRDNCTSPTESGFHQSDMWQDGDTVETAGVSVRVRVNFKGIRPEDLKLYAVYVEQN